MAVAQTQAGKYDIARANWIGDYMDPGTFLDLWVMTLQREQLLRELAKSGGGRTVLGGGAGPGRLGVGQGEEGGGDPGVRHGRGGGDRGGRHGVASPDLTVAVAR